MGEGQEDAFLQGVADVIITALMKTEPVISNFLGKSLLQCQSQGCGEERWGLAGSRLISRGGSLMMDGPL